MLNRRKYEVTGILNADSLKVGDKIDSWYTQVNAGNSAFLLKAEDSSKKHFSILPGCYNFVDERGDTTLSKFEIKNIHMLDEVVSCDQITKEANNFFSKLEVYKELNMSPKRSILLYSQPGVGKTATINSICRQFLKEEGTSVQIWDTTRISSSDVSHFYTTYSEIDSSVKKLILIIEDVDLGNDKSHSVDSSLLNLLDGIGNPFQNVPTFIIATTNSPEKSIGALIDRPGRFDRVIEVLPPSFEDMTKLLSFFLKRPLKGEEKEAVNTATSAKFSIAHLKEVAIRHRIEDISIQEAVKQLMDHKNKVKKNFTSISKLGII